MRVRMSRVAALRGADGASAPTRANTGFARGEEMSKARIATVWLDGCSGCHMSFLDMDERLLDIAAAADLV